MKSSFLAYAIVTLLPVPALIAGVFWGGIWVFVPILYFTFFAFLIEKLLPEPRLPEDSDDDPPEPLLLPFILVCCHFVLLPIAIYGLITEGPTLQRLLLAMGFIQFFGIVSISNAHELIHRRKRLQHNLGKLVFISLLFGHHTSAHLLIHHRYVATPKDPNSAKLNESFYHFWHRAWLGSFRAGLRAETDRRKTKARGPISNPYIQYLAGALFLMLATTYLGGSAGLLAFLCLAISSHSLLLLTEYVQHYGLRRKELGNGSYEPVSNRHSWNAPQWYSGLLMLNSPRHSDHHTHPAKPYQTLIRLEPDQAPQLPHNLIYMVLLALFPYYWRKVMNPLVAQWHPPAEAAR